MKSRLSRALRLALATMLFGAAGVVATSAPASANSCTDCVQVTPRTYSTGYKPGWGTWLDFELKNPLTMLTQKITLQITLPKGMTIDPDSGYAYYPDNGSFTYDPAKRLITVQPESSTGVIGSMNPKDTWSFGLSAMFDDDVTAPELRVTSSVAWATRTGIVKTPTVGKDIVFTPSKPYILQTTTSFSPSPISSGGTSVMTSTITNTGTGGARAIYFYMKFDDRLTVDMTTVPAGCEYRPQDTWESWTGATIVDPQHLSCEYSPVLAPGQSVSFSVTVTAPSVTGAAQFEGSTELSCTSAADAAHDETDGGDSVGLLLIDPPPAAKLHVVQMGGPKPIDMPTADAEPLQPTAGKTHMLTTYTYNIGGTDITSPVTVAVSVPAGFAATDIGAETTDSAASAPVCTLATHTCVFSRLGTGKVAVIFIKGDLSPSLADDSKLTVSAEAGASSVSTATDSAEFAVTSLADVRVSVTANGAYVAGSPVAFSLAAKNLGPSDAKSPQIKVTLPSGASFTSIPSSCTATGSTMTCKWKRLEANGVDGEEFTATFGSAAKASVTAELTTVTPLTKDSVTKDSLSQEKVAAAVARAIATAVVESRSNVLPATGSGSREAFLVAMLLMASGTAVMLSTRRRRVL